jgi:hypothetical protein
MDDELFHVQVKNLTSSLMQQWHNDVDQPRKRNSSAKEMLKKTLYFADEVAEAMMKVMRNLSLKKVNHHLKY